MASLIDTFLANIKQKGFVKSNRFVAFIRPNRWVTQKLGYASSFDISTRLAITCYSSAISTPTFLTHEFGVTNPQRVIPYGWNANNSSGISLEFYCLGDYFEKEVFYNWMRTICDPQTREIAYYDDFTKGTEIDIVLLPNFEASFEGVMEYIQNTDQVTALPGYTFTEVYPYMYNFNGGNVNYSSVTAPASVKVDFMFREMHPFSWKPDTSVFGELKPVSAGEYSSFKKDVVNKTLEDSQRDFAEYKKRLNKIEKEREKIAKEYDQRRNVPRGVDGKLLNPKVDGLPAENPNDRISSSLFGALSFVQQGRGFGIF